MQLTVALMTYNRGGTYFRCAMEAILSQTYSNFALLILDNHSTDETPKIALEYQDPRVTYIRQPIGSTPDTNFCSGIWMSCSRYVLITHDDDIMEPTLLERYMDFISKHPKILCLASNVSLIDEENRILQKKLYNMDEDRIFNVGEYIKAYLGEKLWLPTPTYMYRRDAMIRLLGLEAERGSGIKKRINNRSASGDILMNCLLNSIRPIGMLADPLLRYRQHGGQHSRNVHQGRPVVAILRTLKKKQVLNVFPRLLRYRNLVNAALLRFEVQDKLFSLPRRKQFECMQRHVTEVKLRFATEIPENQRAMDSVIPLEILLYDLRLKPFCKKKYYRKLWGTPAKNGAVEGFRNWLRLIHAGGNLFDCQLSSKKIAVFGSMMAAFLIVLEAHRKGIEVICCIDSSPARFSADVLGVPIIPLQDLKQSGVTFEAVILSNERDHEDGMKRLLLPNLPTADVQVVSWKQMARESLRALGRVNK